MTVALVAADSAISRFALSTLTKSLARTALVPLCPGLGTALFIGCLTYEFYKIYSSQKNDFDNATKSILKTNYSP